MRAARGGQLAILRWVGWGSLLLAVFIAAVIVSANRQHHAAIAAQVRERNRLRMLATQEHIEDHMASTWLFLRLVSLDPLAENMSPGPWDHLQVVHEATYVQHRLTELYITERDFDGTRHPFLTLVLGEEGRLIEGHHTLEAEAEEYAAHMAQIRRFAEDPSLEFLVSEPVLLCIGEPGIVCSVPVRSEGELTGIVAGMVPSDDISEILDAMSTAAQVLLANDNAGFFTCLDFSAETAAWFQERFAQQGVQGFFEQCGQAFRVGDYQALWGQVNIPGDEKWYVAYVYDEATYLQPIRGATALAGWGSAALVLLLGGAVMFLCHVMPALAAARARADTHARELAENEMRTRAIVDTAADGIITIGEGGAIQSFNAAAEEIFGYAAEEVMGKNVNLLMPSPHSDHHDEYISRYLQTGEARIIGIGRELEGRRKDGTIFPLEVAVSKVCLPGRRLFTGILRDISERRRSEEALRESEERYRALVQNIDLGVTLIDADYRIVMTNAAQARTFDKPTCDFVRKHCFAEFEKRDAVCPHCPGTVAMATGRPAEAVAEGVRNDGSRFVARIHAFPAPGLNGEATGFIEIVEDITERRRSEERARQQQAELAHVSRLSAVGELASGLAHELNQPLCAILTLIQGCRRLTRSGQADPEEVGDAMDEVALQAERAGEIIRRLREFVRKRDPRRSSVDINESIRAAVGFLEAEARHGAVSTRLELADQAPPVLADPIQIQQVVVNLLSNAIEAMKDTATGERVLTIRSSLSGSDVVEVAVHDTGEGFSGDALERMFEPFYTTKSAGIGVGLSISRSIIEALGGRLWATRNPDQGMTFRFTLPTTDGDSHHGAQTDRVRRG